MAETSKNKIYYNDDENSAADVLADMKKLAQSTDDAIEKSKYDDTQIKKDISNMKTEITAKDNEQDNKILQLQTEKAELEKELKEAQEDFYQNSIRGQASGEYIHVEDSSNCRAKIGIGGNSEQETRSGKNLLELMEGTYSNNGVTAVVKDGIITLNGTATAISFVGINLLKSMELTNDKTYHLSAFNEKTAGDGTNYCSLRINQDNIQVLFNKTNANGSITTNLKISYITIRTQTGITYNNFVVKPQLEIGNGTDTWEQGGESPSPDYPSQVKAVGDNVNLFDKDKFNNFTNNLQYIELTLKSNTKYTMCSNIPKGTGGCNLFAYKKGETASSSSNFVANGENRTVTTGDDGIIIIAYRNYNASLSDDPKNDYKYKLAEGTEVGEYSKNGQGSVKVTKCNKNLVNVGENSYSTMGLNITLDKSRIKINGTPTSNNYIFKKDDINAIYLGKFKKGTYYMTRQQFSGFTKKGNGFSVQIRKDVWNGTAVASYGMETTLQQKKVVLDEDVDLYLTMWANKDDIYNNVEFLFSIYSDTDVNHVQHQEQSYIIPTQQEMLEGDYFDYDNEEEVHTWNKLVLDGTENWNMEVATSVFQLGNIKATIAKSVGLSNSYKYNTIQVGLKDGLLDGEFAVQVVNNISYLYIRNNSITTLEQFKTYLKAQYDAGTPVTIFYKTVTPTRLKFIDEQKSVAKELNNARTYKNVTNITTDSIAILDLDYAKDLETLITSNQKVEEV